MKLTGIRIKGFKNIKDVTINLNDSATVLIAGNGHGKSNLIDAIDFAVRFIHADRNGKTRLMWQINNIPMHRDVSSDRFYADLMLADDSAGKEIVINYGFEFAWFSNTHGGTITKEWLNVREEGKSKRYTKLIERSQNAYFKSSRTGRCSAEISASGDELVLNRLRYVENLFYGELIDALNHLHITVIRPEDMLDKNHTDTAVNGSDCFEVSGIGDLPEFMYRLKKEHCNLYSYILSSMQMQFEDIEGIDVHKIDLKNVYRSADAGAEYYLTVTKENYERTLDYTQLSRGELYTLFLLAKYAAVELRGDALIAIDEPENSIHPGQYNAHAQTIAPITMDYCNVLIASQSPFFVQYFDPDSYYIGSPRNNGIADFAKIDRRNMSKFRKDARSYGESPGVYVYDLLSSSEDEIDKLEGYLEHKD